MKYVSRLYCHGLLFCPVPLPRNKLGFSSRTRGCPKIGLLQTHKGGWGLPQTQQ